MDRMKRIIVLTFSILAVAILASASSWEGSAMMGAYGDFPPGGYFAACNSFPRNTAVEVTNLETGKTVTVIIVRGLDNPGIFMMVSAEAAEALGLRQGKITRVRAVEPRSVSSLAPSAGSRRTLDTDFNPRLLAAEELKRMGYELVEAPVQPLPSLEEVPVAPEVKTAPEATEALVEAPAGTPGTTPEMTGSFPVVIAPLPIPPLAEGPELVQDLVRPEPVVPTTVLPPVPSPEAPRVTVDDKPDAINGGKPKPVRTVVLPELPEPELFFALAAIDPVADVVETGPVGVEVLEEPKPEIFALTLPVPDETPIRVSPAPVPRRFEAPAALPDVIDRPRSALLTPDVLELSLAEPMVPGPEGVVALPREFPAVGEDGVALALAEPETEAEERARLELRDSPTRITEDGSYALAEPVPGPTDRVVAHELMAPARRNGIAPAALVWPELEADEIPDIVLARLTEPVQLIPATSLAEGEVIFPQTETPLALALETPTFAAAETRVALAAPEVEPLDQAEIHDPKAPGTIASAIEVELAEAGIATEDPRVAAREAPVPVQATPEVAVESPALEEELPGEVIVVLEPTDLRPPVLDAPVVAEAVLEPELPVVKAPDPVVKAPDPVKPAVTSVPVKPAMTTGALEKGRHYIQVGAYRSEAAAAETVSVLRMDYVIVLETQAGSNQKIWKIFVGPMGRDESGMALLRVRSLGFKDAFLKVGG
jgi:hypothetical protein